MDVGEFLRWIETAPAARRAEAAHALARDYLYVEVDAETRNAMEVALTVLLDDPATDVRLALADSLGSSDSAPRHIIVALAADDAEVASLVLARSPLFIDAELIDIAGVAACPLQVAIARRPVVSTGVAAAIAEVGDPPACLALAENPGDEIARISFRRMAERLGGDAAVRDALLMRADLPVEVRQQLVRAVGDRLSEFVSGKAWLTPTRATTVTREACDRATVSIAAETATEELEALVEHLRVTGQLTTALLLRTVCAGNIPFFETALSVLSKAPLLRIVSLVRGGRMSGLRAAYSRAALPLTAFDAFVAAIETWRQVAVDGEIADRYRFTRQTVDAVLARYSHITDGEMNELTAMLRRFAADQAREAARDFARSALAA